MSNKTSEFIRVIMDRWHLYYSSIIELYRVEVGCGLWIIVVLQCETSNWHCKAWVKSRFSKVKQIL
jgi:hypothetical protein